MNELFDVVPDRCGSGSYKWDEADSDVIPLWVADMDFKAAPCIIEALKRRVNHGVFGYTLVDDDYYTAIIDWMRRRHGCEYERRQIIYTSGVVPALSAIIKALAPQGSGVIVQTPVYNCFFSSIRNNGCYIEDAPLLRKDLDDSTFTYEPDFEALERSASKPDVKLMLLCNPHNPAGRLWTPDELRRVAEICNKHGVTVVSDEIHCELTAPGTSYTPYYTIDRNGVVCLSPSKAFNTAGLQIANIICPNQSVREAVDRAININEVCDVNPFGPVALKAAYSKDGEKWLDALRQYLWENYTYLLSEFQTHLPQCRVTRLEATYLPCIDISSLGITSEKLEEILLKDGKVWVNSGVMYGKDGFIRINIATSRQRLAEGLRRIISTCRELCR